SALAQSVTLELSTPDGTTPAELFRDTLPGGPRRTGLTVTPTAANGQAALGLLSRVPVEVRLAFDQPLDPASTNVPVGFDRDPARRDIRKRGRIWLEYDDPERGQSTWLPAAVSLAQNTLAGAVVVLRPLGVLPNAATVRVLVLSELADISGQSNANDPG